jgi:hypothetical protein
MTIDNQTTRRAVVKTGAKLAYTAPLVAATMKLSSRSAFALVSGGQDCLGHTWNEFEYYDDQWHGTWTRVSGNVFTADWTGPGHVTADLEISIECSDGGAVHIVRTGSSDGNDCIYDGVLTGNQVSGTYVCDCCGSSAFPWHATIS